MLQTFYKDKLNHKMQVVTLLQGNYTFWCVVYLWIYRINGTFSQKKNKNLAIKLFFSPLLLSSPFIIFLFFFFTIALFYSFQFLFWVSFNFTCLCSTQCKNDEEIVAVIAHELGHWKLNHTMYSFIAVQVGKLIPETHDFGYSYFKSVSNPPPLFPFPAWSYSYQCTLFFLN